MNGEMEGMTNKETFDTLVDIKVALGTLSEQVKQLTDMKETIETTRHTAQEANARSIENEKDIGQIRVDMKEHVTKEELKNTNDKIKEAKQEKKEWWKNAPSWVGVIISVGAVLVAVLYH